MTHALPPQLPLRIGTRGSLLALAQANQVKSMLATAWPELAADDAITLVIIKTTGDIVQDRALAAVGGKGAFTKEIEQALLDNHIDLAVHSMKDVPAWLPEGLAIPCILPREDVRDGWFSRSGASLMELPAGAVVGTSSLRRQAQILAKRPDLKIGLFRGNVQTRLQKLADGVVDATLLAVAGLNRLGEADKLQHILPVQQMLPAVAQGAIGIEIRKDDTRMADYLAALHCPLSATRVTAERAFLMTLDGSCHTPIAALAEIEGGMIHLDGLIAETDGSRVLRQTATAPASDAENLGIELGSALKIMW